MGCLARFSQILADFEHVTRRARYVEEQGQQVFRGGQDRGICYYQRLFNYLQYYALDAYEDFEGEDTFDLDAVDILTVHQARGWSGRWSSCRAGRGPIPVQVCRQAAGLADPEMRFPAGGSQTVRRRRHRGAAAVLRRHDAGQGHRLPLPLPQEDRTSSSRRRSCWRWPAATPPWPTTAAAGAVHAAADEAEELPTVSFSELAAYEGCPLRYRFSRSLGFQPQLVTELGYGGPSTTSCVTSRN